MGARTLRSRLTARFAAIAGVALAVAAIAAVALTSRALDRADSELAGARAEALRGSLVRELQEGDSLKEAAGEVEIEAHAEKLRLAILPSDVTDHPLETVRAGTCDTLTDEHGTPWRACARGDDAHLVIAAVEIGGHRDLVAALARGMAIVVLVVLLAILALTRQALRAPIGEVTALVDWTSKVGRAEAHLAPPVAATKEIEELTRAFDQLLTDTLVRERATSAHIAHELRTPLTALLADDTLPQAARQDLARLSEVIDAILVLSDTHAQRPSTLVNVADVVRSLAPKETRVDAPDEALTAGDERLLSLAIRNLVDNARKHAGGPPVAMRVSRQDDFIRVSVVDEGPGATEEERARMFDRYWRGVADGTGRGLGLALVRAVAERHGGIAEARAAKKGLDAGFTVRGVERWSDPR